MVRTEVSEKVIRLLMVLNDYGVTVEDLFNWILASVEREFEETEGDERDRFNAICKALYQFEIENICNSYGYESDNQ
ncbi:MAG: hypothetical protein K6T72_10690 [Anoxybacillus sp.]|nr:hypothetical protein [Anoxybacillus sp.]MCL6586959.1 hypothetical protein [Anoxybacillus sp.]